MVRIQFTITLPKESLEWLDKKVESRIYDTRAHGIELLILSEMEREGQVKKNGK